MAGLFGLDEDASLGLLTAALAAMSARGVRPGTALAQGGLLGIGAMQNAKQGRADAERQKREDEFRQMQMDDYRRKLADAEKRQQGMMSAAQQAMIPGTDPVEFGGGEGTRPGMPASFDPQKFAMGMMNVDPMAAAQMLAPKAQESPYAKINPKDYTLESLRVFSRTRDPSVLVPREEPKAQDNPLGKVGPSDFTPASVQAFIAGGGKDYSVLKPIDKRPIGPTIHNYPALPPNHMWADPKNPRAGVVAIPGGPADTTKRDAIAAESKLGTADNVRAAIAEAKKFVGPLSAGAGGALLDFPGFPAANLEEKLEPIRATLSFAELGKMREESKTGGALGQITVRELDLLSSQIASLKRRQSPAQLMKSLDEIDRRYATIQQNLEQIRSGKASPQTRSGKIGTSGGNTQVDDLLKLYGD